MHKAPSFGCRALSVGWWFCHRFCFFFADFRYVLSTCFSTWTSPFFTTIAWLLVCVFVCAFIFYFLISQIPQSAHKTNGELMLLQRSNEEISDAATRCVGRERVRIRQKVGKVKFWRFFMFYEALSIRKGIVQEIRFFISWACQLLRNVSVQDNP